MRSANYIPVSAFTSQQTCKRDSDCGPEECCVKASKLHILGNLWCYPKAKEGEDCGGNFLSTTSECGCVSGTSCQRVRGGVLFGVFSKSVCVADDVGSGDDGNMDF